MLGIDTFALLVGLCVGILITIWLVASALRSISVPAAYGYGYGSSGAGPFIWVVLLALLLLLFFRRGQVSEADQKPTPARTDLEWQPDLQSEDQSSDSELPLADTVRRDDRPPLGNTREKKLIEDDHFQDRSTGVDTTYHVQVGAYAHESNAHDLRNVWQAKVAEPVTVLPMTINGQHLHKVLIGKFSDKGTAQAFQARHQIEGHIFMMVSHPSTVVL